MPEPADADDGFEPVDDLLQAFYREQRERPGPGTVWADDFGAFALRSVLGEGGMGQVFLAEQNAPVRRSVALKILRSGADTPGVLLRFAAEQQALARMNHDHIARVFDAGRSRDGRPFFVMEYVDGLPVTAHCDRRQASIEERLRLFLDVCDAVQYAHDNGVLHRDLKPSNVLVAGQGERHTVKVIDFGLARLLGDPGSRHPDHSRLGAVLGTPNYMSPEQASGAAELTPGTDVYSLGVMLFELLVGSLPFVDAGAGARRRAEDEPPLPSRRLASSGAAAAAISACRGLDPVRLARRLRGELDWVVARALQPELDQRYPSARGLADDLRAWLAGRPVAARAESRWQRVRRWFRRHPALAGGIALGSALAPVGALLLARTFSGFAGADAAAAAASEQRMQGNLQMVKETLAEMVDPDRLVHMPSVARRQVLELALKMNQKRVADGRQHPTITADVALAQAEIGIALATLGRAEEAKAALLTAQSWFDQVHTSGLRSAALTASVGRIEDALGQLARDRGDRAAALAHGSRAAATLRDAVAAAAGAEFRPALATALAGLVEAHYDLGQFDAALAVAEEQIGLLGSLDSATAANVPPAQLLRAYYGRGLAQNGLKRFDAARDTLAAGVALADASAGVHQLDHDDRLLLARTLRLWSRLLQKTAGDRDEGPAGDQARRALAEFERLIAEAPSMPEYAHGAADCLLLLAEYSRHADDPAAAIELYQQASEHALRAVDEAPHNRRYLSSAAYLLVYGSRMGILLGRYRAVGERALQVQARAPGLRFPAAQVLAELTEALRAAPSPEERAAADAAAAKAVELLRLWLPDAEQAARKLIWTRELDPLRERSDFNALVPAPHGRVDDHESVLPVISQWSCGLTSEQLAQFVQDGWRITDFELETDEPPRFAAAMVRNDGPYRRDCRWLHGVDAAGIAAAGVSDTLTVLDFSPLGRQAPDRWSLVAADNDGTGMLWSDALTTAGLRALAKKHGARPIAVSVQPDSEPERLSVVFVGNHLWNFRDWRFVKALPAEAEAALRDGWAIGDLARLADDSLRCIQTRPSVPNQRLRFAVTADALQAELAASGARVAAFCTYRRDGIQLYDAVLNPGRP